MRQWILPLLSLLLATGLARDARGYELMTTSEGVPVVWMVDDVAFYIDDAGTAQLDRDAVSRAVAKALDAWSYVPGVALSATLEGVASDEHVGYDARQNVNLVAFEDEVWPYGDHALAVTLSTWSVPSGELLDADIAVNTADFDWAVDGRTRAYDLTSALAHELGHAFGLGHSDVPEATMYASMAPSEITKRDLHADDIAGFRYLYGDGDVIPPSGDPDAPDTVARVDPSGFDFPSVGDASAAIPSTDEVVFGCRTIAGPSAGPLALLVLLALLRRPRRSAQND